MAVPSATIVENMVRRLSKHRWMWTKIRYHYAKLATRQCSTHIIRSPYKDVYIPKVTLHEYILSRTEKYADYPALVCGVTGRQYTYWQLQQSSKRFAVSLLNAGMKPGQVLAVVLANCPEFGVIALGALQAGLHVSTVNHNYTAAEMAHQLHNSGTVCVATSPDKIDTVLAAKAHIEQTKISFPIKIIAVDIKLESLPQGIGRYSELVDSRIDVSQLPSLRNREVDHRDVAFLPFSSGTTGLSKGVQLSHRNIVSNIVQVDDPDINCYVEPSKSFQEVVPGILPFFHIYGLTVVLLRSLCYGTKIVTMPKFDQDLFEKVLRQHKCTVMYLVPPLVLFIGSSDKITSNHLSSFRYIVSGAAPLGAGDIKKCLEKMTNRDQCTFIQVFGDAVAADLSWPTRQSRGVEYLSDSTVLGSRERSPVLSCRCSHSHRTKAYGMTETSPITLCSPKKSKNLSSVGLLVSSTKAKVVNYSTGETVGPNERGELCFKGPQIMLGYHNNPEATAATIDKDGWLHTGDISYYDENNYFYIVDRIKELIKVKGFQVPPAELEELLRLHPAVDDAGVIGIPDTRCGEVPVGYIVPVKHKCPSIEELKHYVASNVSPHKQLADIVFVDSIPKSAAGKILRRDMKALYLESKH